MEYGSIFFGDEVLDAPGLSLELGFRFSTGMENFFLSLARTLVIMVIQARFLIFGVLSLVSFLGCWVESSFMGSCMAMLWYLGSWLVTSYFLAVETVGVVGEEIR